MSSQRLVTARTSAYTQYRLVHNKAAQLQCLLTTVAARGPALSFLSLIHFWTTKPSIGDDRLLDASMRVSVRCDRVVSLSSFLNGRLQTSGRR